MKSILLSIRPKWVEKILNKEKTIEVRKQFPKDYVGWVYIYCTKDSKTKLSSNSFQYYVVDNKDYKNYLGNWNGKVLARFWCDKVEEHRPFFHWCIEKETCLTRDDVLDYLDSKDKFVGNPKRQGKVYAIHISKLEVFDEPKELNEFETTKSYLVDVGQLQPIIKNITLTKAPQNYCYIEGEE